MEKNTKKILLVEDNLAHQMLIRRAFEDSHEPVELITADCISRARDYLSDASPDLVISDFRLPDGDGTELLLSDDNGPLYPVVIMTGQGDEHIAVDTIKAGARDYVIKSDASMAEMPSLASRVLRDWKLVVERQQAKLELKESEERYRLLVERSPDAIAVIDHEYKLVFANPATATLLKVPDIKMLLGKSFLELLDAREQEEAKIRVMEMLGVGEVLEPREYRFRRFDGTEVYGAVTSTPLTYKGKKAIQTITRDITARKLAEEALQKAHDGLEDKVNERTSELKDANKKLLELDRLKSMFIASMSHELRTPLNSIIGFTGVMLGGMSGELNERQQDQMTRVNRSAKHLLSLVSDVIDISKVEAGKIAIEIENFSLNALVSESIDSIRALADEKNLSIKFDPQEDITIHSDRRRLYQVVLNMVSNAVKYTEKGEVSCVIDQRPGNRLRITVKDTGIGITEEAIHKLFIPFERLDKLMRVKVLGTGLGLYLSKKLVEDVLQGEIQAESVYGKGSTFWVELPLRSSLESTG